MRGSEKFTQKEIGNMGKKAKKKKKEEEEGKREVPVKTVNAEAEETFEKKLGLAAVKGNVEDVQSLLDEGADPNKADHDEDGETPLHGAAFNGHKEVVKVLLDRGAGTNKVDKFGNTPLHRAAVNGHQDVVQLLLDEGADPNKGDKDGWTSLHAAAAWGHRDVLQLLLDTGAQPNKTDEDGNTPLHDAAMNGHKDVVQVLLDGGAQPDIADRNGCTPLHLAARQGHEDVAQLLLDRGANEKNTAQKKELNETTFSMSHDDDGGHVRCTCKSESQKGTPKKKKKLTQKEIGKIIKRAKDKQEGKREVPLKTVNASCKVHSFGLVSLGFGQQEISVGKITGCITYSVPGVNSYEDTDGNLKVQIPGFQDVVLSRPSTGGMTKESGTKLKKGAKEDPADTIRDTTTVSSHDCSEKKAKTENDTARDRPSSESSTATKVSVNDVVTFEKDRYMKVLESMKAVFKCTDESNEVEIGKWQHDIVKEMSGKIDDIPGDADELATCSHCGMVEFDMLMCSGCRVARFCDTKACRENFATEHRTRDHKRIETVLHPVVDGIGVWNDTSE